MPSSSTSVTPRGFHTHAKEFFSAAEAVASMRKPALMPLAFLWGRTIELVLKSYLLSKGVPVEVLRSRKYGHNLVALYAECVAQGILPLVGKESFLSALVEVVNLDYGTKRFEYRESGTMYTIPDAAVAQVVIRRLLKGVNFHLSQLGI
jgi:hypothetical protein